MNDISALDDEPVATSRFAFTEQLAAFEDEISCWIVQPTREASIDLIVMATFPASDPTAPSPKKGVRRNASGPSQRL